MSTPLSKHQPKEIHNLQARLIGAWTFVGIPLAYGIIQTVRRASALFG